MGVEHFDQIPPACGGLGGWSFLADSISLPGRRAKVCSSL